MVTKRIITKKNGDFVKDIDETIENSNSQYFGTPIEIDYLNTKESEKKIPNSTKYLSPKVTFFDNSILKQHALKNLEDHKRRYKRFQQTFLSN